MIVRMLRVATAGVIFMVAAGAQAQGEGPKLWYVAVGAGGAWYNDQTITGAGTGKLSTDPGYTANVAIGRYLDDIKVVRLEVEGLYDSAEVNNFGGAKAGGTLSNAGLMFNFLYDIQTGTSWIPYLGGGIGYSRVNMDNVTLAGVTVLDGTDNVFAYQFKGGVAYQFNPSMAVTVGYRYYATDNLSFGGQPGGTIKTGGTQIQSAEVGFRFHF
jgi:opacity protein-like surface antigen